MASTNNASFSVRPDAYELVGDEVIDIVCTKFSPKVAERLKYYVYLYIDPRMDQPKADRSIACHIQMHPARHPPGCVCDALRVRTSMSQARFADGSVRTNSGHGF